MNASLSLHVTDAVSGNPIPGMRVQAYWVEPGGDVLLRAASTNDAGTTAAPLVSGAKLSAGVYKLVLHAGDWLATAHADRPRCVDLVPVVIVVEDAAVGRRVDVTLAADGYAVRCV